MNHLNDIIDNNFICIGIKAKLATLLNLIPNKNNAHIIVINDNGTVAGVVLKTDIIEYFTGLLRTGNDKESRNKEIHHTTVKALMTVLPFSIYENEDIEKAVGIFEKYKIHLLPVLNKNNKVLGIITLNSLLHELKDQLNKPEIKSGFNFNNHRISSDWISSIHHYT